MLRAVAVVELPEVAKVGSMGITMGAGAVSGVCTSGDAAGLCKRDMGGGGEKGYVFETIEVVKRGDYQNHLLKDNTEGLLRRHSL